LNSSAFRQRQKHLQIERLRALPVDYSPLWAMLNQVARQVVPHLPTVAQLAQAQPIGYDPAVGPDKSVMHVLYGAPAIAYKTSPVRLRTT